jgi:hypothetical protein
MFEFLQRREAASQIDLSPVSHWQKGVEQIQHAWIVIVEENDISWPNEISQSLAEQGCFLRAPATPVFYVHGPRDGSHPRDPGSHDGRGRDNTERRAKQPGFKTTPLPNRLLALAQIPKISLKPRLSAVGMPKTVVAECVAPIEYFLE